MFLIQDGIQCSCSNKKDKNEYLKDLGAKNILDRSEFNSESKLLEKGLSQKCLDTVGGNAH